MNEQPTSNVSFPFYGHNEGLVISGPDQRFAQRPMTPAELAARVPALTIAKDIYRHANQAGVCYVEMWELIAKAMQALLDERAADEPKARYQPGCLCTSGALQPDDNCPLHGDGVAALPPSGALLCDAVEEHVIKAFLAAGRRATDSELSSIASRIRASETKNASTTGDTK